MYMFILSSKPGNTPAVYAGYNPTPAQA
jgi:hypothetical protein